MKISSQLVSILLFTLVCVKLNDGQDLFSFNLLRQYYHCKYLNMSFSGFSDSQNKTTIYSPDQNKTLNDSFYKKLPDRGGLINMTFDQGMNLTKTIFKEASNCKSFFCKCINGFTGNYPQNASLFVNNETNFAGFKSIISSFNDKFKSYLKPLNQLVSIYPMGNLYPTIVNYLSVTEFTGTKLGFYDTSFCEYNFNNSVR